jgi:hypothetical protein
VAHNTPSWLFTNPIQFQILEIPGQIKEDH